MPAEKLYYYCPLCGEELEIAWVEEAKGYKEKICHCPTKNCGQDWKITTDPWFGQIVKIERFYFG